MVGWELLDLEPEYQGKISSHFPCVSSSVSFNPMDAPSVFLYTVLSCPASADALYFSPQTLTQHSGLLGALSNPIGQD